MTTKEAFDLVLYEIAQLDVPYASRKITLEDLASVPQYPLDPKHWVHVSFRPFNEKDKSKVQNLKAELNKQRIHFDSAEGMSIIDWELDWSFKLI